MSRKGHKDIFGIVTNLDQKLNDSQVESLMSKHERSLYMLSDIKDINSSKADLTAGEMSREFAKQCYKYHTFPISSFVI